MPERKIVNAQLDAWMRRELAPAKPPWGLNRCPNVRWGIKGGPGITLGCYGDLDEFAENICRAVNLETGECDKLKRLVKSGLSRDDLAAELALMPGLGAIYPDVIAALEEGYGAWGVAWPEADAVAQPAPGATPSGGVIFSSAYLSGNRANASGSATGQQLIGPGFITSIAWGWANPYGFTTGTLEINLPGVIHVASISGLLVAWRSNSMQLGRGYYLPPGAITASQINSTWVNNSEAPFDAQLVVAFQPLSAG